MVVPRKTVMLFTSTSMYLCIISPTLTYNSDFHISNFHICCVYIIYPISEDSAHSNFKKRATQLLNQKGNRFAHQVIQYYQDLVSLSFSLSFLPPC